jgi:hypothetical protein
MKLVLLAVTLAGCAGAQGPGDVPPILQVIRKPGGVAGAGRPYAAAKANIDVVGMSSMTGQPETWLVELHSLFASIEDLDRAMTALGATGAAQTGDNLLAPERTVIALYQPGWSYRPQEALRRLGQARYFHVTIYRMRAGTGNDLEELMKLRRHEMDAVNLDRPDLIYRVVSGEPSGTCLVLAPLVSLKVLDDGVAKMPVYAEPLATAEAAAGKLAASGELGREHYLFRVEPRLSYVSDSFAGSDAGFWRGKTK